MKKHYVEIRKTGTDDWKVTFYKDPYYEKPLKRAPYGKTWVLRFTMPKMRNIK